MFHGKRQPIFKKWLTINPKVVKRKQMRLFAPKPCLVCAAKDEQITYLKKLIDRLLASHGAAPIEEMPMGEELKTPDETDPDHIQYGGDQ